MLPCTVFINQYTWGPDPSCLVMIIFINTSATSLLQPTNLEWGWDHSLIPMLGLISDITMSSQWNDSSLNENQWKPSSGKKWMNFTTHVWYINNQQQGTWWWHHSMMSSHGNNNNTEQDQTNADGSETKWKQNGNKQIQLRQQLKKPGKKDQVRTYYHNNFNFSKTLILIQPYNHF